VALAIMHLTHSGHSIPVISTTTVVSSGLLREWDTGWSLLTAGGSSFRKVFAEMLIVYPKYTIKANHWLVIVG